MRIIGAAVLVLLVGCSHSQPIAPPDPAIAASQAASREKERAAQQAASQNILNGYYSCVRLSAATQITQTSDVNLAAENAFLACQTEEQRLRTYMALSYVQGPIADALVLRHKTVLKQEITGARR